MLDDASFVAVCEDGEKAVMEVETRRRTEALALVKFFNF